MRQQYFPRENTRLDCYSLKGRRDLGKTKAEGTLSLPGLFSRPLSLFNETFTKLYSSPSTVLLFLGATALLKLECSDRSRVSGLTSLLARNFLYNVLGFLSLKLSASCGEIMRKHGCGLAQLGSCYNSPTAKDWAGLENERPASISSARNIPNLQKMVVVDSSRSWELWMVDESKDVDSPMQEGQVRIRPAQQPGGVRRVGLVNGACDWTISVIVPVHQPGPAFERCLECIRAAKRPADEVIVVLDGETEEPAKVAEQNGLHVVRTGARSGPAVARNLGARCALGDILFFTDADVAIPETAVHVVLDAFRRHPEMSAVIGSYDDSPSETNLLSLYKNLFHHYVHQNARPEGYTFWGAGGAIRRQVFLDLGGYDERYRYPSIEDIELGYRLRAAGHRILVLKTLQVKHLKRWTVGTLFTSDFFRRALPWTELILETGRFENDLNISRSNRIKVVLVFCLLGMLGTAWWWSQGLLVAAFLCLILLAMDAPLLRFFRQKRGVGFALGTIPWHWFYYWYSGVAFVVGLLSHRLRRGRASKQYSATSTVQPLTASRNAMPEGRSDGQ